MATSSSTRRLGSAAAWPLVARAQRSATPIVGFLSSASRESYAHLVSAFLQGLSETGYVEGRNVEIEYRWGEGQYERLPALAVDLVQRRVAVIAATGSANAAESAKAATSTIPIVFANGSDPVKLGFVSSLNRPGGNATGISFLHNSSIVSKRLDMLRTLVPQATTFAFLVNPDNPATQADLEDVQSAPRIVGQRIIVLTVRTENEIDAAYATLVQQRASGLLVNVDAFFYSRRNQLVTLAARHALPAFYYERRYVADGGLISYGASNTDGYRQAGNYVGRILKGARPADLPVLQPTKFELVINLKTAKALGLTIPETLLATADEVIQ
jgi:putative tryptophan/tyrosine transport system substrate-binding protein